MFFFKNDNLKDCSALGWNHAMSAMQQPFEEWTLHTHQMVAVLKVWIFSIHWELYLTAGTLPPWNKKHCLKCCCPDCISELCYYYKFVLFIMSTIISTNLIREAIAILETSLQTDTTLHLSVILSEHIYSLHCAFFISF